MYENVTMLERLHQKNNDSFFKQLRNHIMTFQLIKTIIFVINSTATTKSVMSIIVIRVIRKKNEIISNEIRIINEAIKITIISEMIKNTIISFVIQSIFRLSISNDSLKLLLSKRHDRSSFELFLRSRRFQLFHRRQFITTITRTKWNRTTKRHIKSTKWKNIMTKNNHHEASWSICFLMTSTRSNTASLFSHVSTALLHSYLTIKTSWKIMCWIFINSIYAFSKSYDDYNRRTRTSMRKNMFTIFFSSFFMGYVTIQISIFDWELTSCLNTDENVFLCDSSFVFRDRDVYDFVKRTRLIIIIEVVDMKVLNKYIEKKMLLNFNKVFVIIKAYLVEGLQFDFIIDMNVLNRTDIDFMLSRKSLRVKNIDISLCYASSFSSKKTNSHYFYHFMTHDIFSSYTWKWKSTFCFIIKSRSSSFSINEKLERSNFATLNFTHQLFTSATSKISHMKLTLVFNKKFADSKLMCQSTEIEVNSFKNRDVFFNSFFRKCRHCKQFFIFENLFHRHLQHCNKSIKEFKHVRIIKKLNDFWRKRSNWRIFMFFH